MIFKTAIVGAGNLGSRHLQALKLIKRDIVVTVCEANRQAAIVAQERYDQLPENLHVKELDFISDYKKLPLFQDLIIVATSSKERYSIAKWIIENLNVKHMILEKVVFQEEGDFDEFSKCIKNRKTKVWVNCPRRMFDFYKMIKQCMRDAVYTDMIVSGSSWGLGCNSIHMLDLYRYLTDFEEYEYDNSHLEPGYIESKRKGYVEFTGQILIRTNKGNLTLKNYKDGTIPLEIILDSDKIRGIIKEYEKIAYIQNDKNMWSTECMVVDMRHQSNLTNIAVEQLIETGECDLTKYDDTILLHNIILSCFLNHINKYSDIEVKRCPIT